MPSNPRGLALLRDEIDELFHEAALDRVGLGDRQCLRLDRLVSHRCFSLSAVADDEIMSAYDDDDMGTLV